MADPQAQADQPRNAVRHLPRLRRDHEDQAREVARRRPQEDGGRNNNGRITTRHHGGGSQAPLPRDRLQAQQGRRSGQGRGHRVRPEPLGMHRSAALRRRREALHPCARSASRWAMTVCIAAPRPTSAAATPAARRYPRRHHRAQRRAAARPRRPAGPLGRHLDQLMAKEGDYAILRLPSGEMRMVRARVPRHRSARSATPTTRTSRSARPAATARWACARRPRHRP